MRPINVLFKFVIIVGGLGALAYYIMQRIPKTLTTEGEATIVAKQIAEIIGPSKTELSNVDLASVESKINSMATIQLPRIEHALEGLPKTNQNGLAAELIMMRFFDPRPDTYRSQIEGDPWTVLNGVYKLGPFTMVRDAPPTDIAAMIKAFQEGSTAR
ncbi:MAG TPA: hypothetical protein VNI20_11840 [Fimbriimonadaceae bacterium]|nr:hypothetical protein [Fimbriimonadaceae bacterium]